LLTAAPVIVSFVIVLKEDRTLPEIAADVVQGAVKDTALVTLQVTVPLETVIVASTGAVIVSETTPVEPAETALGMAAKTHATTTASAEPVSAVSERCSKNRILKRV